MIKIHQGIDLVEITKFRNICVRNDNFISDIFTEQEIKYCRAHRDKYLHLAGRFAAKEACLKALGTGLSGQGLAHPFRDIEVLPNASGKPQLFISGWLSRVARTKKINQLSISISHSGSYAVAAAILVGDTQIL